MNDYTIYFAFGFIIKCFLSDFIKKNTFFDQMTVLGCLVKLKILFRFRLLLLIFYRIFSDFTRQPN